MVRCRLDGPDDDPARALRYVPLAEFELWRYLMETRHAPRSPSRTSRSGCPRTRRCWTSAIVDPEAASRCCASASRGRARRARRCPSSASSPRRPIREAQEALLAHFESGLRAALTRPPGYFVPAAASAASAAARSA